MNTQSPREATLSDLTLAQESRHANLVRGIVVGAGAIALAFTLNACSPDREQAPHPPTPTVAPTPGAQQGGESDLLAGRQWDFMQGANRERPGLRIHPLGFALRTEQDTWQNSNKPEYEPIHPVNDYGIHLATQGNFKVTGEMADIQPGEAATVFMHRKPSWLYDERTYIYPGLSITAQADQLTVRVWKGGDPNPEVTKVIKLDASGDSAVPFAVTKNGEVLTISSGTSKVELPYGKLFGEPGEVWFGADATRGNGWRLDSLKTQALDGGEVRAVDTSQLKLGTMSNTGLQALARRRRPDLIIGTAVDVTPLAVVPAYAQLVGQEFGGVAMEMAGKTQSIQPKEGVFDFHRLDALVDIAERNDKRIHGHTTVFGEANPKWLEDKLRTASKAEALDLMRDLIKTEVGRYKGRISSWDIVNEPFDADDWRELREHLWYKAIGKEYIAEAFKAAHEADPNTLLFLNDWALEGDDDRWAGLIELLEELQAEDIPIHGVGFQAHVADEDVESGDVIDPQKLADRFRQLEQMGLKVRVSEISVPGADKEVQAQQYAAVLRACMQAKNCVGFNMWAAVNAPWSFTSEPDSTYRIQIGNDGPWNLRNGKPSPSSAVAAMKHVLVVR